MTHIEKSQELFSKNFQCSQAVLAAFAEAKFVGLAQVH